MRTFFLLCLSLCVPTFAVAASNEALVGAAEKAQNVVQLMAFSFILGSLFTVLMLLLLDFMKFRRERREASKKK